MPFLRAIAYALCDLYHCYFTASKANAIHCICEDPISMCNSVLRMHTLESIRLVWIGLDTATQWSQMSGLSSGLEFGVRLAQPRSIWLDLFGPFSQPISVGHGFGLHR